MFSQINAMNSTRMHQVKKKLRETVSHCLHTSFLIFDDILM